MLFFLALQLWWMAMICRKRRAAYAPKRCLNVPLNIRTPIVLLHFGHEFYSICFSKLHEELLPN